MEGMLESERAAVDAALPGIWERASRRVQSAHLWVQTVAQGLDQPARMQAFEQADTAWKAAEEEQEQRREQAVSNCAQQAEKAGLTDAEAGAKSMARAKARRESNDKAKKRKAERE